MISKRGFNPTGFASACQKARAHTLEVYPHEACGAILHDGTYRAFQNVAPDPENYFDCADERAPLLIGGQIAAMIHSHPYPYHERRTADVPRDFGPSELDMKSQLSDGVPWGIIATDGKNTSDVMFWGSGVPVPPLMGRPFRHGPSGTDGKGDCYALIKDYYAQEFGIDLPEGPRTYDWWHHKQDLYSENFKRAKFRKIPPEEARAGDVFLAQINASVPNHGGILEDGGVIVHHLQGRVSRRDSLPAWRKQIVGWLRHADRDGNPT